MPQAKELKEPYKTLFKLLRYGKHNAKTLRQLAVEMDTTPRNISEWVSYLVTFYQIPVCGSRYKPVGMYLPTKKEDMQQSAFTLRHHADNINKRADVLESAELTTIEAYKRQVENPSNS